MTGFVYAIESGSAVKIGWAIDPERRLAELNVGSPARHKLLGFVRGTKEHECELHRLCVKERIRGEWFRNEGVVSLFIERLNPYSRKIKSRGKLDDYIRQSGVTEAEIAAQARCSQGSMKLTQYLSETDLSAPVFAERAGLDASTIWRIVKGKVQPDLGTIAKISATTNGEVTLSDFLPEIAPAEPQAAS